MLIRRVPSSADRPNPTMSEIAINSQLNHAGPPASARTVSTKLCRATIRRNSTRARAVSSASSPAPSRVTLRFASREAAMRSPAGISAPSRSVSSIALTRRICRNSSSRMPNSASMDRASTLSQNRSGTGVDRSAWISADAGFLSTLLQCTSSIQPFPGSDGSATSEP